SRVPGLGVGIGRGMAPTVSTMAGRATGEGVEVVCAKGTGHPGGRSFRLLPPADRNATLRLVTVDWLVPATHDHRRADQYDVTRSRATFGYQSGRRRRTVHRRSGPSSRYWPVVGCP